MYSVARLVSSRGMASVAAVSSGVFIPSLARCEGSETPSSEGKAPLSILPIAEAATFGGISGFCSGFALKKVGRAAAATFGFIFIGFQAAAYSGYVSINWAKVEKDVMGTMDLNNDGKVDSLDARYFLHRTISVLSSNMAASGTGFTAGFLLGLRKG